MSAPGLPPLRTREEAAHERWWVVGALPCVKGREASLLPRRRHTGLPAAERKQRQAVGALNRDFSFAAG
jgi:hypothetical protein